MKTVREREMCLYVTLSTREIQDIAINENIKIKARRMNEE